MLVLTNLIYSIFAESKIFCKSKLDVGLPSLSFKCHSNNDEVGPLKLFKILQAKVLHQVIF